jgi:hypothetical protein
MRKWTVRLCVSFFFALLIAATLYECSSHVVRGWLRGEAFYDGRPTSWWSDQCDAWLNRFDTPEDAVGWAEGPLMISAKKPNSDELVLYAVENFGLSAFDTQTPHRRGYLSRLMDWMVGRQDDNHGPKVLRGYLGSVDVARELAMVPRFERMAKNSLRRAERQREQREQLLRDGFQPIDELVPCNP